MTIHPLQFHGLVNLNILHINYNNFADIPVQLFTGLSNLKEVDISQNNIYTIHPQQFQRLNNLRAIRLFGNKIRTLHHKMFEENTQLLYLDVQHNDLYELHPQLLHRNIFLHDLDASSNVIVEIYAELFKHTTRLSFLWLSNNRITSLSSDHFDSLGKLRCLDLRGNNLITITFPNNIARKFRQLQLIFLSYNKLHNLPSGIFQYLNDLKYLDLSDNKFNSFGSRRLFNNTIGQKIEVLDLRGNDLYWVDSASFVGFNVSTNIQVDNGGTCCFVHNATCIATIPPSQFLTCGRLLPNQVQRVIMWILSFFAIFSNIGVLCYKLRQKDNNVQMFLISNLSLSDLLMGIYICSLLYLRINIIGTISQQKHGE